MRHSLPNNFGILISNPFLLGLTILLANDFYFKPYFHNWVTGKLSDFSGLFIFPLFLSSFFPKFKKTIFIMTGVGFVFWKSPASQPFIDLWNAWNLFPIQRVIDYTDLLALGVLPIALVFSNQRPALSLPFSFRPVLVSALCIFAFMATTRALTPEEAAFFKTLHANNPYSFHLSLDNLAKFIDKELSLPEPLSVSGEIRRFYAYGKTQILLNSCPKTILASFTITETYPGSGNPDSNIALSHVTDCGTITPEEFRAAFEDQFITPLQKKLSLNPS